jgi:D-glucosaminate-6-phosphate ammonia-lyase
LGQLETFNHIDFEKLGIRRVINCYGPATILGGSILDPRVTQAMEKMSRCFVDMDELLDNVNSKIARILDVEAAHVTSGAGSGLALAAAACMTGTDQAKIQKLPDTSNFERNEIVIQTGHRNTYERCLSVSGAKLVPVGIPYLTYPWQLRDAISVKTAAVSFFTLSSTRPGVLGLEEIRAETERFSLPIIADSCNEVLPNLRNVRKFFDKGADLLVLSGGKTIQGPNDTGIVCGSKDLVDACRANSYPHMNGIGRTMKVSKEQIVGLYVALEVYSLVDPEERLRLWTRRLDTIQNAIGDLSNAKVRRIPEKSTSESIPTLEITPIGGTSVDEIVSALKAFDPPIVLDIDYWTHFRKDVFFVNPSCLIEGDELIVADALKAVLSDKAVLSKLLSKKSGVRASAYP